jgi:WD40 repeat protein
MPSFADLHHMVLRLALSPDGRMLFVSTFKKVIIWDRVHGMELRTQAGGGEQIAVWPDGKSVLTNNAALQRWDVDSGKPMYADTFALGHVGEVRNLAWSADGRRLASDSMDGTLRVWDTVTGRPLHFQRDRKTFRAVSSNIARETGDNVVALSPNGRHLLSNALGEDCLKMWDAETGKEFRTLAFPAREQNEGPRRLFRARISTDGARSVALLGSQSNFHAVGEAVPQHKLVVWDAKSGERLICRPIGWMELDGSAIAPDGRTYLYGGVLRDVASGKEIARLEGMGQNCTRINVAFSRDGALVVGEFYRETMKDKTIYLSADGVRIWETATGKTVAHLKTKPWVEEVAFHPNNRFIATNDRDGIRIWDVVSGKAALHRRMPEIIPATPRLGSYASCPTFSADGRLATGHPDGSILIWDFPLPPRKREALAAEELEGLWGDLASTDAAKAWRAVWRLADAPQEALAFLRGRVRPYPTAEAELTRKLLADLDSDSFDVREAAGKHLKELSVRAEPALRAALKDKPSLELRRRIEPLLAKLAEMPQPPTPEELRQLRALIVLERIGTAEARRLLEQVGNGPLSARRTRQAAAALPCMR